MTTTAPSTTTTALAALDYQPVSRPTTTLPPVDRSDLDTALVAAPRDAGDDRGVLGLSDAVVAVVLGIVALGLLVTGAVRRWMERA